MSEKKVKTEFLEQAVACAQKAVESFWDKGEGMLLEFSPVKPGAEKFSFLWGYGAYLTMLTHTVLAGGDKLKGALAEAFEKLELYATGRKDYFFYNSHPEKYGEGEPYYDDNAWVVLALLDAYEIFGEREYLEKAVKTFEYVRFGENKKAGGIYWREFNCNSMNTCSCGPAIMCAERLSAFDSEYLKWAERLYCWTVEKLMDADGTFFDSVNEEGSVAKEKYTYNTGTMIYAGAALYGITKEKEYLEKAKLSAEGAHKYFIKNGFLPASPWFNVYLLEGCKKLAEFAPCEKSIGVFEENLEFALKNARTPAGLFNPDWSGKKPLEQPYYHAGLDQFGTIECLALVASEKIS